jgi:hypothetical protein
VESNCDLPAAIRKKRYTTNLGVQPTHPEDPRKWYLPESAGENGRALHMDIPWRNVAALGARHHPEPKNQGAIVAAVAEGVEKLSVKNAETIADKNSTNTTDKNSTNTTDKNSTNTTSTIPGLVGGEDEISASAGNIQGEAKTSKTAEEQGDMGQIKTPADHPKSKKGWKRTKRDGKGTEQGEDDMAAGEKKRKALGIAANGNNNPGKAENGKTLGKRGDFVDTNQNQKELIVYKHKKARGGSSIEPGDGGSTEATSPGAAGQLTGANVGAYQEK